jgi:hypothetical protein
MRAFSLSETRPDSQADGSATTRRTSLRSAGSALISARDPAYDCYLVTAAAFSTTSHGRPVRPKCP